LIVLPASSAIWPWRNLELDVFAPAVLATLTVIFILLAAVAVRVLGTNTGYKTIFVILGIAIMLKTMFGW
jgi:hypothetical protein